MSRALRQLFPGGAGALRGPVGQPELTADVPEVGHPGHRVTVHVTVTARGRQCGTGGVDRRAIEGTFVDRPRDMDAETAHLADGCDAGVQRGSQVLGERAARARQLLQRSMSTSHAHEVAGSP
jgi:hypothetical protein